MLISEGLMGESVGETKPLWREGDGGPAHVPPVGLPRILGALVVVVVVLP